MQLCVVEATMPRFQWQDMQVCVLKPKNKRFILSLYVWHLFTQNQKKKIETHFITLLKRVPTSTAQQHPTTQWFSEVGGAALRRCDGWAVCDDGSGEPTPASDTNGFALRHLGFRVKTAERRKKGTDKDAANRSERVVVWTRQQQQQRDVSAGQSPPAHLGNQGPA